MAILVVLFVCFLRAYRVTRGSKIVLCDQQVMFHVGPK